MMECLAILFVIIYHSLIFRWNILTIESTERYIYIYMNYIARAILSVCVPLFFFANGYLLFNKDFNLNKHIVRTCRKVIQTLIWGIISLLILERIKNESLSFPDFFRALWEWKLGWINHLWFMGALVCLYIFFPVLKCAFDYDKKIFTFFVIICAIFTFGNKLLNAVVFLIYNALHIKDFAGFNISLFENYNLFNFFNPFRGIYGYPFVYFCVGGLAPHFTRKILQIRRIRLISVCGICLMTLGLGLWGIYRTKTSGNAWDVVWSGYDTIFSFFNVIFIYILCVSHDWHRSKLKRWLRVISSETLGIYFIHMFIIRLSKEWVMSRLPFMCNIAGNTVYAMIIIFLSLLIVITIEEIPIIKELVK